MHSHLVLKASKHPHCEQLFCGFPNHTKTHRKLGSGWKRLALKCLRRLFIPGVFFIMAATVYLIIFIPAEGASKLKEGGWGPRVNALCPETNRRGTKTISPKNIARWCGCSSTLVFTLADFFLFYEKRLVLVRVHLGRRPNRMTNLILQLTC